MSSQSKKISAAAVVFLTLGSAAVAVPSAKANPDGTNVVINEVYGGGGNSGSKFSNDFVELYNPTDEPIDITGWTLEQRSKGNNVGGNGSVELSGTVPARGYFLIQGGAGNNPSNDLPTPDQEAKFGFGATEAIAALLGPDKTEVDIVGWGSASHYEGSPAKKTANGTSIQRNDVGVDTDDNAADFFVGDPTPMNSQGEDAPVVSGDTNSQESQQEPAPVVTPDATTPIADIQGTGVASPLVGQTVTTEGVVTAVFDEGGKNGFFLQTAGTGTAPKNAGDASDGIFIYLGKDPAPTDFPQLGGSVQVTGKVSEFYDQTQITASNVVKLEKELKAPTAIEIDNLPAGDEAREPYEGMIVRPTGDYTVTNNYTLNTYGEIGLAPGKIAHRTPTDVVAPGDEARALKVQQQAELVYLDDGRTRNYFQSDKNTPLPYLVTGDQGVKSLRTGDGVSFQNDVVVDYSNDAWRFQPLTPVTGKTVAEDLPITWKDSRAETLSVPASVKGDYSIASFNVLNYFTSLGENEAGCEAYTDKDGNLVAANYCKVRGAYSDQAFLDQQEKIINAINTLDVDVLGLEEIENTATVTGDTTRRDEALRHLVEELNKNGGNWSYVASPAKLGTDEDYIRVAFIYNSDKIEPVGDSIIFDDPAFTGTARQPLAQEFKPKGGKDSESFVAIVNHFKSKGSVVDGDADSGDGQGNNPHVRVKQSQALITHLNEQTQWADKPVFILGDLNSYSKEDAVVELENAGFTNIESNRDFDGASYQFDGELGSLDHVMGNEAAMTMVQDAAVWNINADESVAFEYSRRNYNAQDFFQDDNPFRFSDHDPIKVGFNITDTDDDTPGRGGSSMSSGSSLGSSGSSSMGLLAGLIGGIASMTGIFALVAGVAHSSFLTSSTR